MGLLLSSGVADAITEREAIEARIAGLAAEADPEAGLYGPRSVAWQVYRERAVLLGGARALLLQIAHPAVARGVAEHSDFRRDPLGRALRTFEVMYALVFGRVDEALAASRRMRLRHRPVVGPGYRADDPALLLWVAATLMDSAVLAYERHVAPLGERREALYAEHRARFPLFGLDPAGTPASWAEFQEYFQDMLEGTCLEVGDDARAIAGALLAEPPSLYLRGVLGLGGALVGAADRWPLRAGFGGALHLLAGADLPGRLREGFGLAWGPAEERRAGRLAAALARVYRRLPAALREVPAYREARARIGA